MSGESELLKKRFVELAQKSYNSDIFTFTDFLGLAEQSAFAEIKRELGGIRYTAFGGANGAERVVIRFGSEEELRRAGATYVCRCTDEVKALFLANSDAKT